MKDYKLHLAYGQVKNCTLYSWNRACFEKFKRECASFFKVLEAIWSLFRQAGFQLVCTNLANLVRYKNQVNSVAALIRFLDQVCLYPALASYTITSVGIFSILFSLHYLGCWQGEVVKPSTFLSCDHFLYSQDLNVWFRGDIVRRNCMPVTHREKEGPLYFLHEMWLSD